MKKPQVWHYHYDSSGHARKHLHFGGRVRHEHVNLHGYGQFTSTLSNNEKDADRRRVKYFGRSTPSRVDAETAMNPNKQWHEERFEFLDKLLTQYPKDLELYGQVQEEMVAMRKGRNYGQKNPGAARHRQEAVSLYKEARTTDSEKRKSVLQIRAAEHVQSAIESEAEGIPNPGAEYHKLHAEISQELAEISSKRDNKYASRYHEGQRDAHLSSEKASAKFPNPGGEHIENRQTGVWDSATLTEIFKQLRKLVDKSDKKALIVTRDSSKGIAEVRGVRTGRLFLRAMQVHGGWIVRWDGKLIARKSNPNSKWHQDRYSGLSKMHKKYPEDEELKGRLLEEKLAKGIQSNPQIDIKCAFCDNNIKSIRTAKMVRGKIYHPECVRFLKKAQGVR